MKYFVVSISEPRTVDPLISDATDFDTIIDLIMGMSGGEQAQVEYLTHDFQIIRLPEAIFLLVPNGESEE